MVVKIIHEDNLVDPSTKTLSARVFERHVDSMSVRMVFDLR